MDMINFLYNSYVLSGIVFLISSAQFEARRSLEPLKRNLISDANNEFTINVLRQTIQESPEKSRIISPFNVVNVLAMVMLGAKNQTRNEMATAMTFIKDGQLTDDKNMEIHTQLSQMYKRLGSRPVNITLELSNGLYPAQDFILNSAYQKSVMDFYRATITNLNYATEAEASRKHINNRVAKATHGKIMDLIPSGILNAATKLVLTSAIYFKGDWVTVFDERLSKSQSFHMDNGKTVQLPFMSRHESDAHVWKGKTSQPNMGSIEALRLDYTNQDFAFYVILPEQGKLSEMIRTVSTDTLREIASKVQHVVMGTIDMPKYKISTDVGMKDILQKLGMVQAFSPQADLSGIAATKEEGRSLAIDDVFHKAFIEVNEKGSVASAASGAVVGLTSIQDSLRFRADRPFLYYIAERSSGAILFIGTFTGIGHE